MNAETNLISKALIESSSEHLPAVELLFSVTAQILSNSCLSEEQLEQQKLAPTAGSNRTVYFAVTGSATNTLNIEKYNAIKQKIAKGLPENAHPIIQKACNYGRDVTPDIQIQIHHLKKSLEEIYQELENYHFSLDPEYEIEIKLLNVSPHTKKNKLVFILKKHGKNVHKVEFTNKPQNKINAKKEKRSFMGGFEQLHTIPLTIINGKWEILPELRRQQNNPESMIKLNHQKEALSYIESVLRNGRKIISYEKSKELSNSSKTSAKRYVSKQTKRKLKNINKKKPTEEYPIFRASISQIAVYYRELLVAASLDAAKTISLLSQSGLDLLFFGAKIKINH